MYILGISSYYHDSAACLIKDGEILSAVQEERFTRIKHDANFPKHSIKFCLEYSNIKPNDIDFIVFYEKPFLKFERLLETYLAFAPFGFTSFSRSMPVWLKNKLFLKSTIIKSLKKLFGNNHKWEDKLKFSEHHLSHAASAFYPSPFEESAILTMDGVGEWVTTSLAMGDNSRIDFKKEIHFPHSLGLLYSAFTYYLGFKVNSGEYKVMGLAPYGEPKFVNIIKDNLIEIADDGSFKLNMSYFDYCTGLKMTNKKFSNLFGSGERKPESNLQQKDMDISASIQKITEEILIKLGKSIKKETRSENLCLAGGVALNCVANGKLLKENLFNNIWIQPASGDAGGAVGAALSLYYSVSGKKRSVKKNDDMKGSYLGPEFSRDDIKNRLNKCGANFKEETEEEIINLTAKFLSKGKAVGWMNGKMEFGPRSLGARSIIADPRSESMQKLLNLKIKYRESFRPFAPCILYEDVSKWFDINIKSPYMLFVGNVISSKRIKMSEEDNKLFGIDKLNVVRSEIPAVTHVDYSARIQTVHKETNLKFHKLISKFKEITGCPILVNTSFNIRGEPIICTPEDAFKCFMGTELDVLVIENFYLTKENQDIKLINNYKNNYSLD